VLHNQVILHTLRFNGLIVRHKKSYALLQVFWLDFFVVFEKIENIGIFGHEKSTISQLINHIKILK